MMETLPRGCLEIFIGPGEYYFGEGMTRIRTLLGSCIAVTMWHPLRHIGGMCHYLVPARSGDIPGAPDGRYGVEAMGLLIGEAEEHGTDARDYQFKVFGGGNMFPDLDVKSGRQVGRKNIACAQQFLDTAGLPIESRHWGGEGSRNIAFDVWSGNVWVKHRRLAIQKVENHE